MVPVRRGLLAMGGPTDSSEPTTSPRAMGILRRERRAPDGRVLRRTAR
jgi:hypothetical protein